MYKNKMTYILFSYLIIHYNSLDERTPDVSWLSLNGRN